MVDIALNLGVTAGKMIGGNKRAWTDSNFVVQTVQSIKKLATQQPVVGVSGQSAQSNNELIKAGPSAGGYSIELWPNDPTWITIHSYSSHRFRGHTKYEAKLSINSHCWLAGYLGYKESEECCNEEMFNWVVGANNDRQRKDDLREVNRFIQSHIPNAVPHYQRASTLEFTGYNEFFDSDLRNKYLTSNCPEIYHSDFTESGEIDSELIAANTKYCVINLLTNEIFANKVIELPKTKSEIISAITNSPELNSGWYAIRFTKYGEYQIIKFCKP